MPFKSRSEHKKLLSLTIRFAALFTIFFENPSIGILFFYYMFANQIGGISGEIVTFTAQKLFGDDQSVKIKFGCDTDLLTCPTQDEITTGIAACNAEKISEYNVRSSSTLCVGYSDNCPPTQQDPCIGNVASGIGNNTAAQAFWKCLNETIPNLDSCNDNSPFPDGLLPFFVMGGLVFVLFAVSLGTIGYLKHKSGKSTASENLVGTGDQPTYGSCTPH